LGMDFEFHYSASSRKTAGYLEDLKTFPWNDKVKVHISDEGTRADIDSLLSNAQYGYHVYTCGPDSYMQSVMAAADKGGFPIENRHLEYFSVPETPDYENHDFKIRLAKSGKLVDVAADEVPTDALAKHGIHIDVKCSDGICGVCKCGLISGDVEHRDFVLSEAQRKNAVILCQSRAVEPDGIIEIDL